MNNLSRRLACLMAALCVVAALAGCTSQKTASKNSGPSVLRYGTFSDIPSFDPAKTQNPQTTYLYAVYDTLTRQDKNHQPIPSLATAFTRPNPTTWRFELRHDVTFQDGSPFDADVVKANLLRSQSAVGNPNASTFAAMTGVTAVDKYTVDVQFSSPQPAFPFDMSLAQGCMVSGKAIAAGTDLTRDPQGSGGWIWDKAASTDGALQVFTKNPHYWNPAAVRVDKLEMHIITDQNARLSAFQTGAIDIEEVSNPTERQTIASVGGTYSTVNDLTDALIIVDRGGKTDKALADPKVRQAVGLALDRKAYNQAVYHGQATPADAGFFAPDSPYYSKDLSTALTPDPAQAKTLLAQAGYASGQVKIVIPAVPATATTAQAIVELLKQAGFDASVETVQPGQAYPEIRSGRVAAGFLAVQTDSPFEVYRDYLSNSASFNAGFKLTDLSDLDSLMQSAATDDNKASALKTIADVERQIISRGVAFPLVYTGRGVGISKHVSGFVQMAGVLSASPLDISVSS